MNLTSEKIAEMKRSIREGNDLFRNTFFPFFGKILLTKGVREHCRKEEVLGSVEIESVTGMYCKKRDKCYEKFFFKIDYYDLDFNYGADPLSEPFKRVLTIMKAEEY